MGTMVGTVITVKELYGIKSADIQFRNGTNSTPLITLEENRKYIVPYFQREIRWTKDNLITLINDVRKGSKFLGNLIFTKRQSDYEILDGQQRTTVIALIVLFLKSKYSERFDIFETCEITVESFPGFRNLCNHFFDLEKIPESEMEEIIGSDCYGQRDKYMEIWDAMEKVDLFANIAETNLNRVIHTPRFYERNPVLGPDKEWEKTTEGGLYAAPFSDGIWYDEKDRKFKMWYLAGAGVLHKGDNQTFYTGYAESEDGKHWTKPVLDIWNQTNIVDTCNRDAATIWLDKQEKDPSKRYKMFNVERRPTDRRWQFILKYSSDGIHWGEGVAQSGDLYDRSSAFYNPFRDVWALSMRYGTTVSSRSRSYLENKDPEMAV